MNAFTLADDDKQLTVDEKKQLVNLRVLDFEDTSKIVEFSEDDIWKYVEYFNKYIGTDKDPNKLCLSIFYNNMRTVVSLHEDNKVFLDNIIGRFLNVLCSDEKYFHGDIVDLLNHLKNIDYNVGDFLVKFLTDKKYNLSVDNMKLFVDLLPSYGFFDINNSNYNIANVINNNLLGAEGNLLILIEYKVFLLRI